MIRMFINFKDVSYDNGLVSVIILSLFCIIILLVAKNNAQKGKRKNNILFWRPQVLKGKGQGLTSNQIFHRMNAVNGEDHLINLEVIIIIIKVITNLMFYNLFNNNV